MPFSKLFIILFIFFWTSGCSKNGSGSGTTKDTTAPVVSIVTPTSNQVYSAGQTIQISANAIDDIKITELHVHVLNKTTGALLRDIHSFPGSKAATVQDSFEAIAGFAYTIKIISFDLAQNLGTAQVDISVQ